VFASPLDFNTQLEGWPQRASAGTVRSIAGRPIDLLEADYTATVPLPPTRVLTPVDWPCDMRHYRSHWWERSHSLFVTVPVNDEEWR
jgi:hypothetical protein